MTPPGRSDPAELLADALALPEAERARYLDRACRGDAALRAELDSLLAAHPGARRFFDAPLVAPPLDGADPWIGRTVGAWRLVRRLATGGMGAVYLGERTDHAFEKRAAIKLVRTGLDSDELLARFRRERQLLANLEHPHIARLLDGGSTPDGLPYLVMEYVDGHRLDEHADAVRLDVPARLDLFLDVCDAVQFAHKNLVIHRDLKPANILVDDSGQVKLLDFGIAGVVADGAAPDLTATTSRRLTPRYASPEQVMGGRMSTATDVYSLGVVLYELLAGRSPYADTGSPFAMERAVLEADIARPSDAVTPEAAERRCTTAGRLATALRGDLDTIVLTALARDPERRYPTVEALADDIRRHVDGRPVRARPDTFVYRMSRFARRNTGLVAGVLAAFVTMIVALVLVVGAYRRAEADHREAEWLAYTSSLAAAESSIRTNVVNEAARQLEAAPPARRGWEWDHLKRRLDRSKNAWRAHEGGITQIVVRPGADLLSIGTDGWIRNWGHGHGPTPPSAVAHFDVAVESAAHALDGRTLVVGLIDGGVYRVALDTGDTTRLFDGGDWARVAVAPDGHRLAVGFFDGQLHTYDLATGTRGPSWRADQNLVIPTFRPGDGTLLTVGTDGVIRRWHPDGRPAGPDVPAHARRIYSLAWSPQGDRLALGSMDQTATVWNAHDWTSLGVFREHRGTVASLAFIGDDLILSSGADGRLLTWDIASGQVAGEMRGHQADVSAVAWTGADYPILTGDWSGWLRVWREGTEDVITVASMPNRYMVPRVTDVRFDRSGNRSLVATNRSDVVDYRISRQDRRSWAIDDVVQAASLGEGRRVATTSRGELVLIVPGATDSLRRIAAHPAGDAALDHRDSLVVTSGADSIIRSWIGLDLTPGITLHAGFVPRRVRLSPDGRHLLAAGAAGQLAVWPMAGGAPVAHTAIDSIELRDAAWQPDGLAIITASTAGVHRWRLDGRLEHLSAQPAACLAASPDGRRLAVGADGQLIRILDAADGRELLTLHGHTGRLAAVAWSPDGNTLASGAGDGTVRFWEGAPLNSRNSVSED
jgi:serine/threonine protein kinase/WD40 repeat protein